MGDNIFAATANSGDASFIMKDGQVVNTAKFKGGFLEQSNVDLSAELSNLIVTQKPLMQAQKVSLQVIRWYKKPLIWKDNS